MLSRNSLITNQSSIPQFDSFSISSSLQDEQTLAEMEREDMRRRQAVFGWLKPTDMHKEQDHLTRIRAEYPDTCHWLLNHTKFRDWFYPQRITATLPKLLWVNGKPGAGKSLHPS